LQLECKGYAYGIIVSSIPSNGMDDTEVWLQRIKERVEKQVEQNYTPRVASPQLLNVDRKLNQDDTTADNSYLDSREKALRDKLKSYTQTAPSDEVIHSPTSIQIKK
jgi:hypothetical protein